MMTEAHSNLQIVKDFLKAVENRAGFDELAGFYHPEILQVEYPNAITKT